MVLARAPSTTRPRRQVMLKALGAKLVLTPAPKGMGGAVKKAEQIVASLGENGKLLQQFNNNDNPKIHRCAPRRVARMRFHAP